MALVLIDIQNDYFKGGKWELDRVEEAGETARRALALFRAREMPVFHVRHINLQKDAKFFLPDTEGSFLHASVAPLAQEKVFIKHTPDSFFGTALQKTLKEHAIKKLAICGMMSHMCVDTTVRSAKRMGYEVCLIEDACTTRSLDFAGESIAARQVHRTFMAALQGTFAEVIQCRRLPAILDSV